jgi:tetratricopeptide (TPR) repeat protein
LIIDRYNNKDSGKIARLTFANICYNAGKYEQAIELYQRSLEDFEKHPAIYNQVLSSLGYAFEQKEDYAGAAGYFDKLSQVQEPTMQGEALFNLGRIYDKMGQTAKSKAVFNKILEDHQDFIYIDLVKEKMAG